MRIRLLHIDECPNWADAEVRLRAALNELGLSDTPVAVELLATPEDTIGTAFAGSLFSACVLSGWGLLLLYLKWIKIDAEIVVASVNIQ